MTHPDASTREDRPSLLEGLIPPLVPPLVHRLNNSLAVLAGALDPRADASERERAREELGRVTRSLSQLAQLARESEQRACGAEEGKSFDLRGALEAVHLLVGPFAAARGIELQVESSPDPLLALADGPRLTRFLVAFVAGQVIDAEGADDASGAGQGGTRKRFPMRLTASVRPQRVSLTLVRSTSRIPAPPLLLGETAELLRDQGIEVLMRRRGAALAYRFRLRGSGVEPIRTVSLRRSCAHVLLVERDDNLRELIGDVLVEAGHEVQSPRPAPGLPSFLRSSFALNLDLALLDADVESAHPGLLATLARDPITAGRVLLLGVPHGLGSLPFPAIEKPFRPGELLDAVDRALAQTVRADGVR